MHKRIKTYATSLVALLVFTTVAAAQRPTLDQVETALRNGDAEQARTVLQRWNREEHRGLDSNTTARAMFLGARLETKAQSAEDAYLSVALSYATSPYAAESLLRLGQARFAAGDTKQGAAYLQRLVNDYPRSEHRPIAQDFLDRSKTPSPLPPVAKSGSAYAIQVAAFRDATNAKGVTRALIRAGFEARTVTVPENALLRVRVGQYATSAEANTALSKLKSAGYSGVVVADVQRESVLRD